MGKKIYIRGSNYGGEMTIGTITPEFVTYWQGRDEDELIEHLQALEDWQDDDEGLDRLDPDSPDILEDMEYYNSWYEIDDIHHDTSSNGLELMAFELDEDGEIDWDKRTDFDPHQLYSRECYTQEEPQDDHEDDNSVPVLVFYSSEKGEFGGWIIELEDGEEFDPKQVAVASVETDHGEMIERLWYKKEEYDIDYDFVDSRGKGYYAKVAWFNKRWEDKHIHESDKELWEEVWEYYDEAIEED
jgi:hypothetical protein